MNSGGRVKFELGKLVRILEIDGTISTIAYQINQERSDRNGVISLLEPKSQRIIKVQNRRILPFEIDGKIIVIESGDRFRVICPCGHVDAVDHGDNSYTCPKCSLVSECYWLGECVMAEAATTKPAKKKNEPKPRKARTVTPVSKVDFAALKAMDNFEVWTKQHVKFDHEKVHVKAHVLLFVGTNPRKLCFNTYDGALGKRAVSLPLDEFVANKPVSGGKKDIPWFSVPDLDKARAQLKKSGYEQ